MILVLDRLEDTEHARFRALSQLIVDKEEGIKAFEDYIKVAFPSHASRKKEEASEAAKALRDWVKVGQLKVTPMEPTGPAKKRAKTRRMEVRRGG